MWIFCRKSRCFIRGRSTFIIDQGICGRQGIFTADIWPMSYFIWTTKLPWPISSFVRISKIPQQVFSFAAILHIPQKALKRSMANKKPTEGREIKVPQPAVGILCK